MKLEAGKYYRTRDGRKVGPIKYLGDENYPFCTDIQTYTSDGMVVNGQQRFGDLIAEWQDEPECDACQIVGHVSSAQKIAQEAIESSPISPRDNDQFTLPKATRAHILDTAKQYVTVDRQATHGKPEDTFGLIAAYWSAHLDTKVSAADVAAMMGLLKLARAKQNPQNADNWIDLAGYAACAGELAG